MIRQISIKTKFGWITAFEEKGKIIKVKFGKSRNILPSKNLKKLKQSFNNFFDRKSKKTSRTQKRCSYSFRLNHKVGKSL